MRVSTQFKLLLWSLGIASLMATPSISAPRVPLNFSSTAAAAQTYSLVHKVQFSIEISPDVFRPQEDDEDDDAGDNNQDYGDDDGDNRHVDWCRRKYRSYRPGSNTWTDYDGNTRECISPFSN